MYQLVLWLIFMCEKMIMVAQKIEKQPYKMKIVQFVKSNQYNTLTGQ
jgi:hypothetical protein